MEKELVDKAREDRRLKQLEKGRPVFPREPLKRTADNNWVHVYCALWVPETKFTKPNKLNIVEGVGAPTLRYDAVCKLCKTANGACVSCLHCHANFHVGCAHHAGYTFGFDITPVKASRRDAVPTVTIKGETGFMTAAIWCKEHAPKTVVHRMNEEVEGTGLVALQVFAKEFKQADLLLTGTARKANLVDQSTRAVPQTTAIPPGSRRTSAVTTQAQTSTRGRQSNAGLAVRQEEAPETLPKPSQSCAKCKVEVSPRWWKIEVAKARAPEAAPLTNGHAPNGHTSSRQGTGSLDHIMNDAPPLVSREREGRSRGNSDVSMMGSDSYLCQKCHWKKINGIEESPEREKSKSRSVVPEPPTQQLPVRSPPVQAHQPVPPPLDAAWTSNIPPPPAHAHPPPPHAGWHPNGPPPPAIINGIGHPLPPGPPLPGLHPLPYHVSYSLHPPNGYPPYSGPPVHPVISPGPLHGHYDYSHHPPPQGGGPPPLHLNGNGVMMNGVHPPHMPYSHPHVTPRSSESPFSGPPSIAQYSLHPAQSAMNNRPSTPRDTIVREPSSLAAPEQPRAGASASPSLQNLLH
jgi:hypothetical protein